MSTVHSSTWCSPYLCLLTNRLIDNVVVLYNLLLDSVRQILHTSIFLLQVDVAETSVEEHLARIEFEEQAQLCVVDHGVSSQVEKSVIEVGQCLFEVAEQEI